MDKEIEKLYKQTIHSELDLFNAVFELDNYMNPCKCGSERVYYNFDNTDAEFGISCLECGGYIEREN
jgi:hypothetical protein